MTEKKSYPRKVLVISTVGFVEQTVNDLLPAPASVLAMFQAGGWSTYEMRMQAFQVLNPYTLPNEDPWIFGYHHGTYQAKKCSWKYVGYASASWSDLLSQMVSCYYTYQEKRPENMYETLLYGCRVHLARGFVYQTVHVLPGNVTGYVVLDGAKVPVFVVDGSKQYEWAISRAVAAVHAAEYRRG